LSVLLDTPFERWINALLLPRCCKSNSRTSKQSLPVRAVGNDPIPTYAVCMFRRVRSGQQHYCIDTSADSYAYATFTFTFTFTFASTTVSF
jgi:hypothetical protein